MEAKLLELEASIANAKRAKALIEHALNCRHRELSICPNFRAALKARLGRRVHRQLDHALRSGHVIALGGGDHDAWRGDGDAPDLSSSTAARIRAVAPSTRGVTASPAKSQPRNTAITGLT